MDRRDRGALLFDGELFIDKWCRMNRIPPPVVEVKSGNKPDFGVCAYYRDGVINIWPDACASIGVAGRQWSYPGYVVDRTPYGVLAHELGHHVDKAHGMRGGVVALEWHGITAEEAITGYAPNVNEWFAEMFRLFVTNPDLLRVLRPMTYVLMATRWPNRAETRKWEDVLAGAERQLAAARNKLREAGKRRKPKITPSLLG